jgi:hypothetical protein
MASENYYSNLQGMTNSCIKTKCTNSDCRGRLCEDYLSQQEVLLAIQNSKKSLDSTLKSQEKQ